MGIRSACATVIVIVSVACVQTFATPTTKPGCTQASFESCGSDLIIFAGGSTVPTTKEELATSCPKEKESEKCARSYAEKCLPRFPRGMVMLLLDGIKGEVTTKCKVDSTKSKEYLKHAACMNEHGNKLHGCMNQLTGYLDHGVGVESKARLQLSCCSFAEYRTCMADSVRAPCGEPTAKYVNDLITGYAGDLLDTVCANFQPGSEACNNAPKVDVDLTREGRSKSLLSPLAKIVSSLQG